MNTSNQTKKIELPYRNLENNFVEYTAGSVVSRMLDGLGFRYYWVTEGLTENDLHYQPNDGARTTEQTIDHILGLSQVVLNATLGILNGAAQPSMSFIEKREKTLRNIEAASAFFLDKEDLSEIKLRYKKEEGTVEYPFWNIINGPISDALWHVGQVVSFRRSSGNPLPKGVNVLTGQKQG